MKLLSKLLFVIISIVALALIIALFVEQDFKVERSINIQGKQQEEVFNYLKHLKNQNEWSVWQQMDPEMKQSYKGQDGTVGFISAWSSQNENVGKGEQVITVLHYPNRIETALRFKEPFESSNTAYFDIQRAESGVTVHWGIKGTTPYPFNIMGLFYNMENEMGPDLEEGLKNLKKELEVE